MAPVTVTAAVETQTPCRLPWLADLAARGSMPAIVTSDVTVTYADLAGRVAAVAASLVGTRRIVLV